MKARYAVPLTVALGLMFRTSAGGQQTLKVWPVGTEFQVNAYTTYDQERPAVAAEANGDFIVVWQNLDEPFVFTGIQGRRFDSAGNPVGTEFQVNTFTTSYVAQRPAVAADTDGDFVVAWDDYYGGNYTIYGRRFDSLGAPLAPEFTINTNPAYYQYNAAAAAQPSGEFVVVWNTGLLGSSPYTQYSYARRYDSAGNALGTEFQINTSGDYYGDEPDVGVTASGDFVVVWNGWFQDADDFSGVFARQHDSAGNPLSADLHVNSYTPNNQYGTVAVEPDGDFVVVWRSEDQDGDQYGVYAQRYTSSGAANGTEFRVNAYTTGSQVTPAVAVDAKGNFVVVWNDYDGQDGDFDGIFGRAFNSLGTPLAYTSSGSPLGTEFQINTYTTDRQQRPAVAAGANGDFVVVWDSYYGQDGSYEGVFGQRLVVAYEVQSQSVGAGASVSTELGGADPVGASVGDPIETQVTTPNPGTVIIAEKANGVGPPSGYSFVGQQVTISAPAASALDPLRIVFQLDNSLRPGDPTKIVLSRNGVPLSSNCVGSVIGGLCPGLPGPTVANPNPCVAKRCTELNGVQLTVLTSAASDWDFALPACPPTPDLGCISAFPKGLLTVKDDLPGKEKLIAKLIGGPPIAQTDFGNPLGTGGTLYNLCIYDDAGALAGSARVNRAGDTTCSGGAGTCWKALGGAPPSGSGYAYKDIDKAEDGITKVLLKASPSGSKILFKGKGPAPPFPQGIPAALMTTTSVTLQVRGDDAPAPGCFSIALTNIKRQESGAFKAK